MRGHLQAGFFFLFLPLFPFLVKHVAELSLSGPSAFVLFWKESPSSTEAGRASLASSGMRSDAAIQARVLGFRSELLMALDLFVRAQRAIRVESSTYTRALGRMPEVLGALTHFYRIEIAKATRSRLLVLATGEGKRSGPIEASALVGDRITIDENYRVHSNFPMPQPPRDYLHTLARTVMNRIYSNQYRQPKDSELELWEGVFRGYFRYEVRPVSDGGRTLMAVGLAAPVKGDVVEMQSGANLYEWVYRHRQSTFTDFELQSQLEDIYLAQRVFQEHTGSYSPTFKGLLSHWQSLGALTPVESPLAVHEFQLDPTFGFLVEVGMRENPAEPQDIELSASGQPSRSIASTRAWSVNGYGQLSEVAPVESVVDQFERARKQISTTGSNTPVIELPWGADPNALRELPGSQAAEVLLAPRGASAASAAADAKGEKGDGGRKPLLIDPIDGDKL